MREKGSKIIVAVLLVLASALPGRAISFDLDSIAAWGRFPRFCVNTYRWGDKFFNTYDSTYVMGSGYKFNAKITTDSWLDYYHFALPNDTRVNMVSDPSTSIGAYLTYLAVSVGYDINISHLFRSTASARSRYRFGFTCSLLSVELYTENNQIGTHIKRFGTERHMDLPFDNISIRSWGLDAYYFFSHKQYSQAAAFSFSKLQNKSHGSFYAGLSIYHQNYDFDFTGLPSKLTEQLPAWWPDHHYLVKTRNYGLRFGYGYNWAFARNWLLAVSFSPTVGLRRGFVNSEIDNSAVSLFVRGKMSLVWNHGRWFAGAVGVIESSIINDRQTTFTGSNATMSAAIGYRFNLW